MIGVKKPGNSTQDYNDQLIIYMKTILTIFISSLLSGCATLDNMLPKTAEEETEFWIMIWTTMPK